VPQIANASKQQQGLREAGADGRMSNSEAPRVLDRILAIIEIIWVWVNTYRYMFSGMNIHLPAILMFTRGTRF